MALIRRPQNAFQAIKEAATTGTALVNSLTLFIMAAALAFI